MQTATRAAPTTYSVSPQGQQIPDNNRAVSGTRTDATMIDRQPGGYPTDRVPSGMTGKAHSAKTRRSHAPSHHSGSDTVREAASQATSRPASFAPTTTSNVKQLVADSRFHDDTLCQLLDAARLNLIGGEAKKALNRAARTRVSELKDMKARGEIEEVPSVGGLKRHHRKKSKDRHGHKSDSRASEKAEKIEVSLAVSSSGTTLKPQPTTPPQWAQDVGQCHPWMMTGAHR